MPDPSPNRPEPVVAQLADVATPAKPQKNSCLMWVLIVGGLGMLMVVSLTAYIYQALSPDDVVVLTEDERDDLLDQKFVGAKNAFSSPSEADGDRDLEEITDLLQRLSSVLVDEEQLDSVVNMRLYAREARRNPELGRLAYLGEAAVSSLISERIVGPIPYDEFQIFSIEDLGDDERKIYLQVWGAGYGTSSRIFYVAYRDRQWKLYDYEPLEYGMRDSRETAIVLGDRSVANRLGYERFSEALYGIDAIEFSDEEYKEKVEKHLNSIEAQSYNQLVQPRVMYDLAEMWVREAEYEKALNVLSQIEQPENIPGAYLVKANIYEAQGDNENAIKFYRLFLDRVGPQFDTLIALAAIHQLENDVDAERECRLAATKSDRNYDYSNFFRLVTIEETEALPELFRTVLGKKNRDVQLASLLNANSPFLKRELEALAKVLESDDPESPIFNLATSRLEYSRGDLSAGLEQLKLYAEKKSKLIDLSSESDPWETYWAEAITNGQAAQAYGMAEDKEAAFNKLFELTYYGDYYLDNTTIGAIAEKHLSDYPTDGLAALSLATAYGEQFQFKKTVQLGDVPPLKFSEEEMFESFEFTSLRLQALFEEKLMEQAVELALAETGLGTLLDFAFERKNFPAIRQILLAQGEPDATSKMYEALLEIESGDSAKGKSALAKLLVEQLVAEEEESDFLAESDDPSAWELINHLLDVCESDGDILQALELAPASSVFTSLTMRLRGDSRFDELQKLAEKVVEVDLIESENNAAILAWKLKIETLWQLEKFDEVLAAFAEMPRNADPVQDLSSIDLEAVGRSALRLKQMNVVKSLVGLKEEDTGEVVSKKLEALLALHQKRWDDFNKCQEDLSRYNKIDFRIEVDCPKISAADMLKCTHVSDHRTRYEFGGENQSTVTLLMEQLVGDQLTIESIQIAFEELVDEKVEVKQLESTESSRWWFINSERFFGTVHHHNQKREIAGKEFAELNEKQKSVIQIDLETTQIPSDFVTNLAIQIGESLAADDCLYFRSDFKGIPWEAAKELRSKDVSLGKLRSKMKYRQGADTGFVADAESAMRKHLVLSNKIENEIYELSKSYFDPAFDSTKIPDSPLIVRFSSFNEAPEFLPLKVQKIVRNAYGGVEFFGELAEGSELVPWFEKGDLIRLNINFIRSWERTVDGETFSGQRTKSYFE